MARKPGIDIKVIGATAIANKYRRAASKRPSVVDPPTKKWANKMAKTLATTPYPPPPAGSTYVRTYTLPTGWRVEKQKDSSYTIKNRVEYAHWVVSKKFQAWMHRGRWWTAEDIMKQNRGDLKKSILKAIKDIID